MITRYFGKMKGSTQSPPHVSLAEIGWSGLGSLLGIGAVAYLNERFCTGTDLVLLIASFGASAVLIFGAPKSPLAQPRNVLCGHLLAAVIGVALYKILAPWVWPAAALAVGLTVAATHATRSLHPPAGATALIAIIGGPKIHNLGFLYALIPVGAGAVLMVLVGLVFNNLPPSRRYPEFWW
jgi:CBS-domain-containing membrane protein